LLRPLPLAETDTLTAAVLVDEFDAGQSEDQSYSVIAGAAAFVMSLALELQRNESRADRRVTR
jgi:hypothetical protein